MKEFKSAFRPSIMEYLEFRSAMGYSNEHEQQLQHFDRYCYEHCPEQTELTKEVVRGWFYDEIARGRSCLSSKATAIRLFAKYLGVSAYRACRNQSGAGCSAVSQRHCKSYRNKSSGGAWHWCSGQSGTFRTRRI